MSKDSSYARGHKETSETGKWDPGGYDMDSMRADLANRLKGGNKPEPEPEEEEMSRMALMISDGAGPDGTVYTAPFDLSSKTPLTKAAYDALIKMKDQNGNTYYGRVDVDAATLQKIPTVKP